MAAATGELGDPPAATPERAAALAHEAGRPLLVVLDGPEEMPPRLAHRLGDWTTSTENWLRAHHARLVTACGPEHWDLAGALYTPGAPHRPTTGAGDLAAAGVGDGVGDRAGVGVGDWGGVGVGDRAGAGVGDRPGVGDRDGAAAGAWDPAGNGAGAGDRAAGRAPGGARARAGGAPGPMAARAASGRPSGVRLPGLT
ncbi:hypothetical protein, partial [Streptomyces sp. NPDC058667]|uniref:hypothetical protein n=1 Tax=Streptomyces sp. NPDC058667 TaxID=3346588 RepID=UPI00364C2762